VSYPRKIHSLIVEDESSVIEGYRATFRELKRTFDLLEPTCVQSFGEAQKHIAGDRVVHLVILDLNLPLENRKEAADGFALGEQLLELLASREAYPVPVVLVVSGKLSQPHSIRGIKDRLARDFLYGELVNKGSPDAPKEIETAVRRALQYVDAGVHIRDAGKQWFPTMSPREEDLLRRCIVRSEMLGVDLRWWNAEPGISSALGGRTPSRGPTKVLMGHFLMDEGLGVSLPTFFKFQPAGNAPTVHRDATILAQKLGHVKVLHEVQSRQRSLIVTQSVTNRGTPVPLDEYLVGDPATVAPQIPKLVAQIVEQLRQLGDQNEEEIQVNRVLFDHLDREAIEKVLRSFDEKALGEQGADPLALMADLQSSHSRQWATRSACIHGDLNASNVAIDAQRATSPQAYIFDAAGMKTDLDYRDLATLEVTTILFNSVVDDGFLNSCRELYRDKFLPASPLSEVSSFARNVFSMVVALRGHATDEPRQAMYALLVFDAALRQLSGLGLQPSPNKVKNPQHACALASWITAWVRNVASAALSATAPKPTPSQAL